MGHLVSLELGGSNDIANLWPEAAIRTPGFHQKERIEYWLPDQVCAGNIALADAQTEIATDWLGAWQAAGEPGPTASAGNAGDTSAPNTITPVPTSSGTLPGSVLTQPSGEGHTYYASTASDANTIYCDTDPDWQRLSPRNLVSYSSLAAAMAALPSYHLHQPC